MNTAPHFSSASVEWSTPRDLAVKIFREYPFTLDVCATPENALCYKFLTKELDGLKHDWRGICWMNPPYGREIGKWIEKAYESSRDNGAVVVCLLPSRTDTKWWHRWCEPVLRGRYPGEVIFLEGRLKFGGHKSSAPFPSVIVVFGRHPHAR